MEIVNFVWQTAYLHNYKTQVRDVHDLIIEKKALQTVKDALSLIELKD